MHLTRQILTRHNTTVPVPVLYRDKIIRRMVTYILKERKPDINIEGRGWIKI
jgi:hypothetical protein